MRPEDRKTLALAVLGLAATVASTFAPVQSMPPLLVSAFFYGGIGVMSLSAVWLVTEHTEKARRPMLTLVLMVVCGVGFVAAAAVRFWPMKPVTTASQGKSADYSLPSLFMECRPGLMPKIVPASGEIKYVSFGFDQASVDAIRSSLGIGTYFLLPLAVK